MKPYSASPAAMVSSIVRNRNLIFVLAKRDVLGRYRGSFGGLAWSFINPLIMLAIYTFVFSVVFKARWPGGSESKTEFAIVLFSGLLGFGFFSECINRAPGLIVAHPSYVKKIVFPIEILPLVAMESAGFHLLVGFMAWLGFYLLFFGIPHATILMLPVVLVPLALLIAGLSWLLASLGTFLRDIGQFITLVTTALLFLSPVFYSVESIPQEYRGIMMANPLTITIEQMRGVMIWGHLPDPGVYAFNLATSLLVLVGGFAWFQVTRRGFGDVL